MNFQEFAERKFEILAMILLNTILLGLITLFSMYGWNPVVLDNLLQWEFGALTAFFTLMQLARAGSQNRSSDNGKQKPVAPEEPPKP